MKYIKIFAFSLLTMTVSAQTGDPTPTPDTSGIGVLVNTDTLNTYEIGGEKWYLLAEKVDSLYQNVRVVVDTVKSTKQDGLIGWLVLMVKLLTSGILASMFTQGIKIFTEAKNLFLKMPKGEPFVLVASFALGFGWLAFEKKEFSFTELFFRTSGVFMVAVILWRAGLSKLFKKKETRS
jgi:hypothetical protein